MPTYTEESSPVNASSSDSRILNSAPPMPRTQSKPSVLFQPPMDDGMGEAGGDPMVQTMMASKTVDMAFQKLATLYPDAVDPLAQLQQQFRQLVAGMISMQSQSAQQAPMIPTLPQQSGPSAGQQQGAGL
jgi:hypothetical protein